MLKLRTPRVDAIFAGAALAALVALASAPSAMAQTGPAIGVPADGAAAAPTAGEPRRHNGRGLRMRSRAKASAASHFAEGASSSMLLPTPKSAAERDARHEVCMSFIRRHGQSCDPWIEPTCGHDIGYFRPLECVAP